MGTRRPGLKSSLFTASDVPGERDKTNFVYKGGKSGSRSPKSSFTVSGSPKSSDTEVHKFNVTEIRARLAEIRKYADVQVRDLPESVGTDLKNFSELATLVSETGFYTQLIAIIEDIFGDIKTVAPSTVGAFFRGCFLPNDFPGAAGCSATCAGMMPPPSDVKGWAVCSDNVIDFDGDKLEFKHVVAGGSNKATIHIIK